METKIYEYLNDEIRPFLNIISREYEDSKKINIPYKKWKSKFLRKSFEDKCLKTKMYEGTTRVRYTTIDTVERQIKSVQSEIDNLTAQAEKDQSRNSEIQAEIKNIYKRVLEPEIEFDYEGVTYIDGDPAWFNSTIKGIAIPLGPENVDLSKPYIMYLNDEAPHSNAQGATGTGKSVLIHNMIFNMALLNPPWELDIKLIDGKKSEMHLYGRSVKLPHCQIVAATDAKEFLLDLFESIAEDNSRRQTVFNTLGVNSLDKLRKEYNLCIPRQVLVVDELLAIITKITDTQSEGNMDSGTEVNEIFSAMSKVATLGRSAGVHMIISSQDLGEKLASSVAEQLGSGVVLKGGDKISKSCIGNGAGGKLLDRIGISLYNPQRKNTDNEKYNVLVGVPFINTDSPEVGFSYPQELIQEMMNLCLKYGFAKEITFYDANELIKKTDFEYALKTSKLHIENNKDVVQCIVPVGKQICFRNSNIVNCTMNYRAGDGFIIDSKSPDMLLYMYNIIKDSVQYELSSVRVMSYYTNEVIKDKIMFTDDVTSVKVNKFPKRELSIYKNRRALISLSEWCSVHKTAKFSDKLVAAIQLSGERSPSDKEALQRVADNKHFVLAFDEINKGLTEKEIVTLYNANDFINTYESFRESNNLMTDDIILPSIMQPILCYWFDMQDCEDVADRDSWASLKDFLQNSARVGFINVISSSTWSNDNWVTIIGDSCRHVLEYSTKEFFMAMRLGQFTANVNQDSLVVHSRDNKSVVKYTKNFRR